jgi:hypothetical protein
MDARVKPAHDAADVFVPRTQRSAPPLRGVVRCRAGAVPSAGVWYGPGSAKHHAAKSGALHRARDTKPLVIAGLDPAIHPLRKILAKMMDARVKPAHDAVDVLVPRTRPGHRIVQ